MSASLGERIQAPEARTAVTGPLGHALVPGKKAAKAARSAADLASRLGDDHDLAVLLGRLGTGDAAEVRGQVQRR